MPKFLSEVFQKTSDENYYFPFYTKTEKFEKKAAKLPKNPQ